MKDNNLIKTRKKSIVLDHLFNAKDFAKAIIRIIELYENNLDSIEQVPGKIDPFLKSIRYEINKATVLMEKEND